MTPAKLPVENSLQRYAVTAKHNGKIVQRKQGFYRHALTGPKAVESIIRDQGDNWPPGTYWTYEPTT